MAATRLRLNQRRALALFVTLALGAPAFAALTDSLRRNALERQLRAEVASMRATGLIERERSTEEFELVAARARLESILRAVADADAGGPGFGAPWMQRPEHYDRLVAGLETRAAWLAELDALPALLWSSAREPSCAPRQREVSPGARLPSNSLGAVRSATNLLCAQAWFAARSPHGAAEAGHRLAQAWALARVTDNGSGFEQALRACWEGIVVDTLERLRAEGIVDRALLDAPLLAELSRDDRGDRLRLAIECNLALAAESVEQGRDAWGVRRDAADRLESLSDSLEYLRFQRAQLREDLAVRRRPQFVPGMVLDADRNARSLDFDALSRDLREAWRARILCVGSPERS